MTYDEAIDQLAEALKWSPAKTEEVMKTILWNCPVSTIESVGVDPDDMSAWVVDSSLISAEGVFGVDVVQEKESPE